VSNRFNWLNRVYTPLPYSVPPSKSKSDWPMRERGRWGYEACYRTVAGSSAEAM
jgi:hypothetical protein